MYAVRKAQTKELSKHDNNDAVDTFYNLKCPGNSLKTILRAAGFHMQEGDSWKDVFVQGRGLYTLQRIQQERPDVWEIISLELVPGLEAWVASVKSRDSSGLPAFECVNGYQALLQWELLAALLQDSAHHFFEHRDSPVFLDLPVFHNPIFTDWLLGDFRQQILQLQLMADVCYKHVTDRRKETTMLQTVSSGRPLPVSAADSQSMLEDVYSRIMQDTDGTAYKEQAGQAAEKEAAAGSKHHAGDAGVVTMPLGSNMTLRKLWEAWEPQQGCDGLRIYKAESPSLYPSDEPRRQQMRWLRKGDGNRFDQFRQVLLTMDRLVYREEDREQKERCRSSHQRLGEIFVLSPSVTHQHRCRPGCGSEGLCQRKSADFRCFWWPETQSRWHSGRARGSSFSFSLSDLQCTTSELLQHRCSSFCNTLLSMVTSKQVDLKVTCVVQLH